MSVEWEVWTLDSRNRIFHGHEQEAWKFLVDIFEDQGNQGINDLSIGPEQAFDLTDVLTGDMLVRQVHVCFVKRVLHQRLARMLQVGKT